MTDQHQEPSSGAVQSNGGRVSPLGPGWWQASDGRWYPPELDPRRAQNASGYASAHMVAGSWPADVYKFDMIPPDQRERYMAHSLRTFPVWAVGVLNVFTLGIFNLIHFGLMHDRLPRVAHDDPSAGKAIGFQFIPFFNYYWIFFNSLRFTDRINLQYRLRGRPDRVPRGFVMACCIVFVIPYIGALVGLLVLWTIAACMLQTAVNELATYGSYQAVGYGLRQAGN